MGVGTTKLISRFHTLALSQKINLAFATFFLINTAQHLVDHDATFSNSFPIAGLVAAIVFLVISRFDHRIIRYVQVLLLFSLSIVSVLSNENPSDVAPFVLLSIGLAAAYKMSLFGKRTVNVLAWTVVAVLGVVFVSGTVHGFSLMQRINLINFVLVYLLLLYFIFEEETLSLRRQRDVLTSQAAELRPFAELGSNVAGLVHDFRNDVAGVSAIASIERLSENGELAGKLQQYADRLNNRIERILYVATAGDHYEPEEIRIDEMLEKVVYYFVEINQTLKHAVAIRLDAPDPITVRTRRNLIMTILENVIKNSVEATDGSASRSVLISARVVDGLLELTVEHNGRSLAHGIAGNTPVDVRRSNYFRRGKSERVGGTGLGMINVIRALEILDAEMTMENLSPGVRTVLRHGDVISE